MIDLERCPLEKLQDEIERRIDVLRKTKQRLSIIKAIVWAKRFRALRAWLDMNQLQCAASLHVTQAFISQIENGTRQEASKVYTLKLIEKRILMKNAGRKRV